MVGMKQMGVGLDFRIGDFSLPLLSWPWLYLVVFVLCAAGYYSFLSRKQHKLFLAVTGVCLVLIIALLSVGFVAGKQF